MKITGKDRKKDHSFISGRWKKIKEDPAKADCIEIGAKQMRDAVEKPRVVGEVMEKPVIKKYRER